jgi:hypothetical protein
VTRIAIAICKHAQKSTQPLHQTKQHDLTCSSICHENTPPLPSMVFYSITLYYYYGWIALTNADWRTHPTSPLLKLPSFRHGRTERDKNAPQNEGFFRHWISHDTYYSLLIFWRNVKITTKKKVSGDVIRVIHSFNSFLIQTSIRSHSFSLNY